ncbi:RHS repeat-associated core domain-containing protein [Pseudomonas sp. P2757]|uniref:RHS repeat-associated core domain-containing protein n=1 Tax=unclassified Pseudomonas TaxID=196821 RepID=UPI003B5B7AA4
MSSSAHDRTPSLTATDGRGLPVRQVAYLRTVAGDPVQGLVSRLRHDAAGRLIEQRDPRLSVPNIASLFDLRGAPLKADSVDAGSSLVLPGVAGEERQRWDAQGNHWRSTYDDQLRPVRIDENALPAVETLTYADVTADPGGNLRGKIIAMTDPSGSVDFHSYALTGPGLRDTRTFHDGKAFVSQRTFSPTGAMLEQLDAGGHTQQSTYDVAGQIQQLKLQLAGAPGWQTVLEHAHYNASGQITEQRTGNGVLSRWLYEPANGRLHRQIAQSDPATMHQDLEYRYDRVGNITAITDHLFTARFFANQRIDGERVFTYDSLYRLHSATGHADTPHSDTPGRPSPTDPNNRKNYTETYEYDAGNNLIKTIHARDGANHTRQMYIDPASNRGVRWKPGDPVPDLSQLFSPAGDMLALEPGMPLHWDSRGQLANVTLVDRNGSSANDEEFYRYSQGERVYKRHETHTPSVIHFSEVRYMQGLEICTRDNGEELHRINLASTMGNVVCLHWARGKPSGIAADQVRYTLSDHLGSAVKELDAQAQLISEEVYLPFGRTASLTARSAVEVDYKTLRYSGKEMDVSGLYYYGARYYAPWLGRWTSADPAGDIDGTNLYAFVGNNPIIYIDADGRGLGEFIDRNTGAGQPQTQSGTFKRGRQADVTLSRAIERHTKILELTTRRAQEAETQIGNHLSASAHAKSAALRTGGHLAAQITAYGIGIGVGLGAAALGTAAGPVGVAFGVFLGMAVKKGVSLGTDFALERTSIGASVKFKSGKLDPGRIVARGEYKSMDYGAYAYQKFRGIVVGVIEMNKKGWLKGGKEVVSVGAGIGMKAANTPFSSEIGAVLSTVTGTVEILHEIAGAGDDLTEKKLNDADAHIEAMIGVLNDSVSELDRNFAAAGRDSIHTYRPLSKITNQIFSAPAGDTRETVRRATDTTITQLRHTQSLIRRVR